MIIYTKRLQLGMHEYDDAIFSMVMIERNHIFYKIYRVLGSSRRALFGLRFCHERMVQILEIASRNDYCRARGELFQLQYVAKGPVTTVKDDGIRRNSSTHLIAESGIK